MADILPGIQPVPSGIDPRLTTMLRQIRERALATPKQFTDAEVIALKRLLTAQPATTTTTATTAVRTVFLDEPYQVYEGPGTAIWTKVNSADAGIPDGATAVVIEAVWTLFGKTNSEMRNACIRIDSAKGNGAKPYDDTFILTTGLAGKDSNIDGVGGFNQGTYPLAADGSFEYLTDSSGNGWTYLLIRIVGYQAST